MNRLRRCPFCKAEVEDEYPYLHYNEILDKWVLDHWCDKNVSTDGVYITVYGKTEQEVIDKWNGVWHEQEHSTD